MKYLLCLLFLFAPMFGEAQCKFQINKKDRFDDAKKVLTEKQKVWGLPKQGAFSFSIGMVDTAFYMSAEVLTTGVRSVDDGDVTTMLFEDGTKMNLICLETKVADFEILAGITFWTLPFFYALSKDDLEVLSKKKLIAIRFSFREGEKVYDIKKQKNAQKINKAAQCVLESL